MTAIIERNQGRGIGRVPPHSREAEESVLGALLLSPHAANEVMDKLVPNDFYVPAHQSIFEAMVSLYNANQPIDAVTLSEELRRSAELEKVGGLGYLTHLVDVVPTASNVEYYAGIVEEHGLRRSLIKAGSTITELAFRTDDEVVVVIDRAEQEVLGVAEKRAGDGMVAVGPLFQEAIEHIEALEANGAEITGLSTGFVDLDKKLAGLQKANLVVIAGRPSMGKCLAEGTTVVDAKTGTRHKIEDLYQQPDLFESIAVLALADSGKLVPASPSAIADNGVKPVFRVKTRLGREVVATANHPLLTFGGWRRVDQIRVGDQVAVARSADFSTAEERSDAEVAVLGYLIGDGSVSSGIPRFTNTNPRIVADLRTWVAQMGAVLTSSPGSPTYRIRRQRTTTQLDLAHRLGISSAAVSLALRHKSVSERLQREVNDAAASSDYHQPGDRLNPVTALVEEAGLRGCTAHTKHVPDFIFRLSKRQVGLFLNRLYSTDGSAWLSRGYYRIDYVTASEQLSRDVQHLLLRLGISAKRRVRRVRYNGSFRIAWEVGIQDPIGVRLFADQIGIFGKEPQLQRVVETANHRSHVRAHSELLPLQAWNAVTSALGDRTWADVSDSSGRPRNHNWHVGKRRLSRRLMAEIGTVLKSASLLGLADSDVIWDPVVSIEQVGMCRTFDLEVPEFENFVADDVIVHNSALTLNVATHIAGTGKVVAIFSLEMAKEEVVQRILSSVGKVESSKLRTGQLGNQWDRLVSAANRMYKTPIYVDDSSVVMVTDIRAKCRRLKRVKGLDLVVVDYLQLMQGSTRENRQQEIAEISRGLKNLARELEVPIIAVSQLNRSVESREDRRPRLSDLRESGALEQDADVVVFIYRHEYYHPDDIEKRGTAEIIIAKHRAGATGTVEMTFMPDFTRFADLGRDLA